MRAEAHRTCILSSQRYVDPSTSVAQPEMLTVVQKDHANFKRDGDDLRAEIELDLKEALTGWQRQISTIDDKQVAVSGGGPTPPGFEERYPGLGMPKSKKPNERGDLIVQVKVKFPKSLTPAQKAKLKEIL